MKYFSYFSQKTDFDISCKLSPMETICIKYQNLFSGKNKKNITNLYSAELAKRGVALYMEYRLVADDILFFFFFQRNYKACHFSVN